VQPGPRRSFPPHFNGKRFFNPGGRAAKGLIDVLRWKLTSRPEPSPRFVDDVQPSKPPGRVDGDALRITLINHSTTLLQWRGHNMLTDPIWSDRASPFSFIGPKRRRHPGVRFDDLPSVDTILLSHNHYDHLDMPTLQRLARRGTSRFIVPLGLARLLRSHGLASVSELDWGESVQLDDAAVHCVPAMHFSARGPFDRDRTLWCGYVIESTAGIIYFAADTGFGPHFESIRERFGPPRVALLPIGAYEPRWFMSPVHMGPDEAIRAHQILAAQTSIAIHHGTFQLGDDGLDTPKADLRAGAPESFHILDNGQSLTVP